MPEHLRYYLQNRCQYSGWTVIDESFEHCGDAICRASELSEDSIYYGQVRVMDRYTGKVIREYPSGPKK